MQSLSCCDIDTICQGGNHQPRPIAEILIVVGECGICYSYLSVIIFWNPVEFQLGLPLELVGLANVLIDQSYNNISGVCIHSNKAHQFLPQRLVKVSLHHFN